MERKWIKRTSAALTALLFAVSALVVVIGTQEDLRPRDAAVVLGSKVEMTGQPSARLAARLDRSVQLYNSGVVRILIVSGGVGKEGFDEGLVMRDYLVRAGVSPAFILVDSAGVDTRATAANCARLMRQHGLRSVTIVTQYFHVPRTRMALRSHGIGNPGSAYARFFELRDVYSIAREVVALPVYWTTSRHTGR